MQPPGSRYSIGPNIGSSLRDMQSLLASAHTLRGSVGQARPLQGRHVALLTESLASPSSQVFSEAATALGATVVHLRPGPMRLLRVGAAPGAADAALAADARQTAVLLGRLYCAIGCDGLQARAALELARWAAVPVLDTVAAQTHPTRLLGDLLAMCEDCGRPPAEITLCLGAGVRSPLAAQWRRLQQAVGVQICTCAPAGDGGSGAGRCDLRVDAWVEEHGDQPCDKRCDTRCDKRCDYCCSPPHDDRGVVRSAHRQSPRVGARGRRHALPPVLLARAAAGAAPRSLQAAQRDGHCRIVQAALCHLLG